MSWHKKCDDIAYMNFVKHTVMHMTWIWTDYSLMGRVKLVGSLKNKIKTACCQPELDQYIKRERCANSICPVKNLPTMNHGINICLSSNLEIRVNRPMIKTKAFHTDSFLFWR